MKQNILIKWWSDTPRSPGWPRQRATLFWAHRWIQRGKQHLSGGGVGKVQTHSSAPPQIIIPFKWQPQEMSMCVSKGFADVICSSERWFPGIFQPWLSCMQHSCSKPFEPASGLLSPTLSSLSEGVFLQSPYGLHCVLLEPGGYLCVIR